MRFWFRFLEPNRSRLEAMQVDTVASEIESSFAPHVGGVWEDLARTSVSHLGLFGRTWKPGGRWWGPGLDRKPMEIDVISESNDGGAILLGEAKWSANVDGGVLLAELRRKAERLPLIRDREVCYALWLKSVRTKVREAEVISPAAILKCLR